MTASIGPWGRIPAELRELPQWVLAGADKVPQALDADGKLRHVSATRPSEWMTFEQAVAAAWMFAEVVTVHTTKDGQRIERKGFDLGLVLHEDDEYTCIDLDVKDAETHPGKPELWSTSADFDRYLSIINTMASYTERSRSGKGIHIWVKGAIGRGFRRGGVEVYSQERYMIMTGDVYVDQPVQERGQILTNMVAQMRPVAAQVSLEELEPQHDDWFVFEVAAMASNSEKFWSLWRGQWADLGFPSQSEADLALMSMFTFYSDSNAQCRRLFRQSGLGKREKTTKNDYHVNKLLKLIRERQAREAAVEFSAILKAADMVAAAVASAQGGTLAVQPNRDTVLLSVPGQSQPVQPPVPQAVALAQLAPVAQDAVAAGEQGIAWPPGLVGKVAQFIYSSSYMAVKEGCIAAALGLMAGICGKAWHVQETGLNLYIIVVAKSATGKEAVHGGISKLVRGCAAKWSGFGNFVDFNEHVSGPALTKACMTTPCFLNVSGEFGRRLKRMAVSDTDGPLAGLRTQMTNLYQKSGPSSIAGGLTYSNAESNVASLEGIAYSMIGETTPGTFYESLTDSMMEDGFLSRFLIISYEGDRPLPNKSFLKEPDEALAKALADIAGHAQTQMDRSQSMALGRTEEAARVLDAFEMEAHNNIIATSDNARRQMWNRANLKVLRIASLLAVGDHYLSPSIKLEHAQWAIDLVRLDIATMQRHFDQGDVGVDDTARERKLVAVIRDYMQADKIPASYKVPEKMRAMGIIPRNYMQLRINKVSCFSTHRNGSARAFEEAIQNCVSNGWLKEVKHEKVVEDYNHHGKAYRVLDLPDYHQQSLK